MKIKPTPSAKSHTVKKSVPRELAAQPSAAAGLLPWAIVLVIIFFAAMVRIRLLDIPLERDEGEYAYTGQLLLQGIPPTRPPSI